MRRRASAGEPKPIDVGEVEDVFDVLRQNLARADAMVCATEHELERVTWGDEDDNDEDDEDDDRERRLDHLAHLLGAAKEAVRAAVYAGGDVAAKLARRQKSA
jgi:hypothetical protein